MDSPKTTNQKRTRKRPAEDGSHAVETITASRSTKNRKARLHESKNDDEHGDGENGTKRGDGEKDGAHDVLCGGHETEQRSFADVERLSQKPILVPIKRLFNAVEGRRGRRIVHSHKNDFYKIFETISDLTEPLTVMAPPIPNGITRKEFVKRIASGEIDLETVDGNHRLAALMDRCRDASGPWNGDVLIEVIVYEHGNDYQAMKFAKDVTKRQGLCRVTTIFDICRMIRTIKLQAGGITKNFETAEVPVDRNSVRTGNKLIPEITDITADELRGPLRYLVGCAQLPLKEYELLDEFMTRVEDGKMKKLPAPRPNSLSTGRALSADFALQIFKDISISFDCSEERMACLRDMIDKKKYDVLDKWKEDKQTKKAADCENIFEAVPTVSKSTKGTDPKTLRRPAGMKLAELKKELAQIKAEKSEIEAESSRRKHRMNKYVRKCKDLNKTLAAAIGQGNGEAEEHSHLGGTTTFPDYYQLAPGADEKLAEFSRMQIGRAAADAEVTELTMKLADLKETTGAEIARLKKNITDLESLNGTDRTEEAVQLKEKITALEAARLLDAAALAEMEDLKQKLTDLEAQKDTDAERITEGNELKEKIRVMEAESKLLADNLNAQSEHLKETLGDFNASFGQLKKLSLRDQILHQLDRDAHREKTTSLHNRIFVDKELRLYHGGAFTAAAPSSIEAECYGTMKKGEQQYELVSASERTNHLQVYFLPKSAASYSKKTLTLYPEAYELVQNLLDTI